MIVFSFELPDGEMTAAHIREVINKHQIDPAADSPDQGNGRRCSLFGNLDLETCSLDYISIRMPNSTTRSGGILKKSVAGRALRVMNENSFSRQSIMPGRLMEGIRVSRAR